MTAILEGLASAAALIIAVGFVVGGRLIYRLSRDMANVRERVSWLESQHNKGDDERHRS